MMGVEKNFTAHQDEKLLEKYNKRLEELRKFLKKPNIKDLEVKYAMKTPVLFPPDKVLDEKGNVIKPGQPGQTATAPAAGQVAPPAAAPGQVPAQTPAPKH